MTASWAWILGACVLAAVLLAGAAWWGDRPEPAHAAPRRPRRAGDDDEDAVTVEWHRSLRVARVRRPVPAAAVAAARVLALRSVLDGPLGAALLLPVSLRCGRCARGRRQPCACARYCGVVVCMASPDCPSPARAGYLDGREWATSPDAVRRAELAGRAIGYGPSYTPPVPVTWDEAWAGQWATAPLPPLPALVLSAEPARPWCEVCPGLCTCDDAGPAEPLPPLPPAPGLVPCAGIPYRCDGYDPADWPGEVPPAVRELAAVLARNSAAPAPERCSDPPGESCTDNGCPLHGWYDAEAEDAHRAVLDFRPCLACGGGPSGLHGECTDMTPAERERWPHLSRPWADTTGTFPAMTP